jgi:hypothetical protein
MLSSYLVAQGAGRNKRAPAIRRPRNPIMTTFDKREEAFEKKYAIDEELKFKSVARRNRLLGLWAAEKLGKSGDAADAYARDVITAEFGEGRDTDVLRKVAGDLAANGIAVGESDVSAKMNELMAIAIAQVKAAL